MTVEKELEEFVNALEVRLESAFSAVDDPNSFLDTMNGIEKHLATAWPPLADLIKQRGLRPEDRVALNKIVDLLTTLEAKTRGRLVWLNDFEDYMRTVLETHP
jgi:hypothetical protein